MDYIQVRYFDLPHSIHGLTVYFYDEDGQPYYTILLNSHDTAERNYRAYNHEIGHIICGDFDKMIPVESLEIAQHEKKRLAR